MESNPIDLWNERVKNEQDFLEMYRNLVECLKNELSEDVKDSKYWDKKINIRQIENEIASKEMYLNSLLNDKTQQEAMVKFKMHLAKEKGSEILRAARNPLMARSNRANELEGILKEKHETNTEIWADWIWRINEVLNKLQSLK